MRKVDDGLAELVDLVEDIVAEQLEEVSVPGLAPRRVRFVSIFLKINRRRSLIDSFVLGAFVDEAELGDEPDEPSVLEFL